MKTKRTVKLEFGIYKDSLETMDRFHDAIYDAIFHTSAGGFPRGPKIFRMMEVIYGSKATKAYYMWQVALADNDRCSTVPRQRGKK